MAKGYQLIQAQTLTSAAASVTFTNIPQNFTDLVISVSARAVNSGAQNISISFNGSSSNFSSRLLYGTGSAAASISYPSNTPINTSVVMGGSDYTANTFNSGEIYIPNYAGSINKTFFSDSVTENNATASYIELFSHLWSQTAAINSIGLTPASGNFATNSTFYLYGIGGTRATGGTITSDGKFTYHTFTSTSTFTALEKIKNAEVLLVAGGGGGGGAHGGGGGAGGVAYTLGQTLIAGTTYTAVIGAGGTAGSSGGSVGGSGGNSYFSSTTATGGGGGGGFNSNSGITGGSGGGGDGYSASGTPATAGSGTANQGYAGGTGSGNTAGGGGGGGGGAGGVGANGTNQGTLSQGGGQGGVGGVGTNAYTSWHYATSTGVLSSGTYYIAGGGGGGSYGSPSYTDSSSAGGAGGGGAGGYARYTPTGVTAGTANTGGGGGGGSGNSGPGAAGGSGLVIVRYPNY